MRRVLRCVCRGGLALVLALVASLGSATAETLPFDLKIEKVLENSAELGNLVQSPTGEIWLLERTTGIVRVLVAGKEKMTLTVPVTSTAQGGLLDAAFALDYAGSGLAFVYYVDNANVARIDKVRRTGTGLVNEGLFLNLGSAGDGQRPGGGVVVGKDGKLYISVGDLSVASAAQDDASLLGKVLRVNLDGTVPADNPSGTLVWAKGFRNGKGMAYNPNTARTGGTFYLSDVGVNSAPTAKDEINQIKASGNFAWNLCSGIGCGTSYVDPLAAFETTALVNPEGLTAISKSALGPAHQGALVYAALTNDAANKGTIRELPVSGAEGDVPGADKILYKPDGDLDGTLDSSCPTKMNTVTMGNDGWIYSANTGDNKGIWRIWRDTPGAREVSAQGTPFPLTIEKSGVNLILGWENLGTIEAGRGKRFATGQRAETYQIFEGSLPITGPTAYNHTAVKSTNGTADGLSRLTETITPKDGNRYFLINAQGDNLEGTLGAGSEGTERPVPGTSDYCTVLGYTQMADGSPSPSIGKCLVDFTHPDGTPMRLIDYNPKSPTFKQAFRVADYRGKVIRIDISALDCYWCGVQADTFKNVEKYFADRDTVLVTIMMKSYGGWSAIAPSQCESEIQNWVNSHDGFSPILCDVDENADGKADAANQISKGTCGTPENVYIDQGFVVFDYACGAETSAATIRGKLKPEASPEPLCN